MIAYCMKIAPVYGGGITEVYATTPEKLFEKFKDYHIKKWQAIYAETKIHKFNNPRFSLIKKSEDKYVAQFSYDKNNNRCERQPASKIHKVTIKKIEIYE